MTGNGTEQIRNGLATKRDSQHHTKPLNEDGRHCGQVLEKLGDVDGARDIYEKGVVACAHKGDRHTLGEIEAALSLLPF